MHLYPFLFKGQDGLSTEIGFLPSEV